MFSFGLGVTAHEHPLLVTEAPFSPPSVSRFVDELAFEEFGFSAVCRVPASYLVAVSAGSEVNLSSSIQASPNCRPGSVAQVDLPHNATASGSILRAREMSKCSKSMQNTRSNTCLEYGALIVDFGHSCTHVVPIFQQRVISHATRRVNIGGRLLAGCVHACRGSESDSTGAPTQGPSMWTGQCCLTASG